MLQYLKNNECHPDKHGGLDRACPTPGHFQSTALERDQTRSGIAPENKWRPPGTPPQSTSRAELWKRAGMGPETVLVL